MAQTIYHIRRDDLETELKTKYGYMPQEARQIVGYLEKSGTVLFNGPTMELKDPSQQDAWVVEGLASGVLGRTMGSQGSYQLKEYLDFMRRRAATYGVAGG
jgi:hypothetical protein